MSAAGAARWPAVALAILAAGCGGSSVCGNGETEDGEQCDDGNDNNGDFCRNDCVQQLPATTDAIIAWDFNRDAAMGFDGDSCGDLAVNMVEVTLTGPMTLTQTASCGFGQIPFTAIESGTYTASVRPLDSAGAPLTSAPAEATFVVGTVDVMQQVVVPPELWTRDYTGTFFFRLAWGGDDCAAATPPVVQHELTLEVDGQPVSVQTENGHPLDGSGPGTCQALTEEFPQSAKLVPFGAARFTVVGLDGVGSEQFREEFDTFVGAGISNPELEFDVNSLAPDAGPDAGAPDAGAPDAGV